MMPPGPGVRDSSPGAWSSRSGPYGPHGSEQGPPARAPSPFADQRPAKRAAPEPAPGVGAQDVEKRLRDLEEHMAVFYSFRDEAVRQGQVTETKLNHLHSQDEDIRKELADQRSQLAAVRIELNQGLPQLTAQVQANAQELAGTQETSRNSCETVKPCRLTLNASRQSS